MKIIPSLLTRCTCVLLLTCASLCADDSAAPTIEGRWIGPAGQPGNEAVFGLEFKRNAQGDLTAALTLDLLNLYGTPVPRFEPAGDGKYKLPDFGIEVAFENEHVVARFAGDATPMHLSRTDHLPPEPVVPENLPKGPEPRWQTKLGSAIYATAALRDGVAYVGTIGGVFHAVKLSDGKLAWTFSAGRPILGEALATDDAVYFTCDNGRLYKLDRATGKELWQYDLGDAQVPRILPHPEVYDYDHEAPMPVLADGVLYVGSGDGGFHAVRADTGQRVWRIGAPGKIRATAAVDGPNIVFGTLDGPIIMVERATGKEVWKFDSKAPVTSSPAVIEGKIIIGNRGSALYGLNPASGERVWRKSWWGSWIESTAVAAGGLAFIGSSDYRRVTCFDPKDGRVVWCTDVFGWSWARPVVAADHVYIATAGNSPYMIRHVAGLCALDRVTGKIKWRRPVPEAAGAYTWGFAGGCAVEGGTLVVGGLDGTLYAFPVQ